MPLRWESLTIGCSWGSFSREEAIWCDNHFPEDWSAVGLLEAARRGMLLFSCQAWFAFQELEMIFLGLRSKRSYRENLCRLEYRVCISRYPDYIISCEQHYYLHVTLSVHFPFIILKSLYKLCISVHPGICSAMEN